MSNLVDVYSWIGAPPIEYSNLGFELPFKILLVSKSGGGKSELVVNFIDAEEDKFDEVIFVVKTEDEPLYAGLRERVDPEWMKFVKITPEIETINTKDEDGKYSKRILLVLDDQIGEKGKYSNQQSNQNAYIYGRKYNVSVIYMAQFYKKKLDDEVRTQTKIIGIHNVNPADQFSLKHDLSISQDKSKAIFAMAAKPKTWIFCDVNKGPDDDSRMWIYKFDNAKDKNDKGEFGQHKKIEEIKEEEFMEPEKEGMGLSNDDICGHETRKKTPCRNRVPCRHHG